MVKNELRVKSGELLVTSETLKVRVEMQKSNYKSTSSNSRVTSSTLRVTSSNALVTNSNPPVTNSNPRVASNRFWQTSFLNKDKVKFLQIKQYTMKQKCCQNHEKHAALILDTLPVAYALNWWPLSQPKSK